MDAIIFRTKTFIKEHQKVKKKKRDEEKSSHRWRNSECYLGLMGQRVRCLTSVAFLKSHLSLVVLLAYFLRIFSGAGLEPDI